jgi:F-type H+-transporting ATPase subunit a
MDQFVVKPLFGDGELAWYSISNATLWFALAIVATALLLVMGTRSRGMIPTRSQSVAEMIYGFVHKMVEDICGKEGLKYFPYIMAIFMFVLTANVIGLLPYSFTTTSHLWVTGALALIIFVAITAIGFYKNGLSYFGLLWVSAAPLPIRPVLFVIELISYFVRPISHSIRLMGNMMAGHAVIKVFAGFAGAMGIGAIIPIFGIVAVYGLEMLVTTIQAYVFTILTCVYLKDALHPSH